MRAPVRHALGDLQAGVSGQWDLTVVALGTMIAKL
jgi:hypothetical protein